MEEFYLVIRGSDLLHSLFLLLTAQTTIYYKFLYIVPAKYMFMYLIWEIRDGFDGSV